MTYTPATNGSAGTETEKVVTDPLEETHDQLVARCHEIMKQVRLYLSTCPTSSRMVELTTYVF